MCNKTVITTFNNEVIDISELTIEELWLLHYEQEKSFANLIKLSKPFSSERAALMKTGYETVHQIMLSRNKKEGKYTDSYGASDLYIKLTEKIVKKVLCRKENCLFFEAGVGTGKIINAIAGLKNVKAVGCDVFVDKNFISSDLNVYECTIYDALSKLDDNTIDVFYWNDVMEHIPEDEIDGYIKLLKQKMAIGGIIITITPNRLYGPCDITKHFEPLGSIAKGFHFHEYTFREVLTVFQKYNISSVYSVLGCEKMGGYVLSSAIIIDKIKLLGEKLLIRFPYFIRKKLLVMMACNMSILKK